jgi:CheY-like chemotaxis protein
VGGNELILVAEDEEGLRDLAGDVLKELGYQVLLAKDGEEAVQVYTENREHIDMLLLDVLMPRMGGPEAYERIRQMGGEIPLIFMTGYSSEMVQSRFTKLNISLEGLGVLVIQKPYSVDGLGRKIREVLDASAARALP